MEDCPFKVGDTVRFVPSEHSKGWTPNRSSWGLVDNSTYVVLKIVDNTYLYVSPEQTNGWHWKDFELVSRELKGAE